MRGSPGETKLRLPNYRPWRRRDPFWLEFDTRVYFDDIVSPAGHSDTLLCRENPPMFISHAQRLRFLSGIELEWSSSVG